MTSTSTPTAVAPDNTTRSVRRRWFWLAVIPILGAGWWLGSPLFIDDVVDEALPQVEPTRQDRAGTGDSGIDDAAPAEEANSGVAPAADATPSPIAVGDFVGFDAVHQGSGSAMIFELDDTRVLRFDEFDVTNGPDLRVNLVLGDGSMIDIGALKGNVGNQNYELPADLDADTIASVLIYCRAFGVPFASADLA